MGLFGGKKEKKEKTSMMFKNITGLPLDKGAVVSVKKTEEGINIEYFQSNYNVFIRYSNIINIVNRNYTEEEIKNKSVVGRALVGGILTGGIGAVVGGMSGIGSKTKKKTVPAFEILYTENGIEKTILLEDYWLIGTSKFMNSIKEKSSEIPAPTFKKDVCNDITEQLKKLSDLRDSGIITEEDFQKGKEKKLS